MYICINKAINLCYIIYDYIVCIYDIKIKHIYLKLNIYNYMNIYYIKYIHNTFLLLLNIMVQYIKYIIVYINVTFV